MDNLTRKEYNYLIRLLEKAQKNYNIRNLEIKTAKISETEAYFLQQKLEKLRDNA